MQENKTDYSTIAGQAFLRIEKIFALEKTKEKAKKYSIAEIAEIREKKSAKAVKEFFEFCELHQGTVLPKSLTGKAINYALSQKQTLLTFLKDPRIELTNNLAEQAVKPFVIGRKNWLFFNTPNGAQASAVIYSIIETVKANGLNPQETLQRIFEDIQHGKCPLIFPQIQ